LQLPLSSTDVLRFIHWLAYKRKVKAGTLNSYLAGIRNLHIVQGIDPPVLRSELVKMILKGRKNIEAGQRLAGEGKQERQPVTPDILRLIKSRIAQGENSQHDMKTAWTVCTLLYHGAFRPAELLVRQRGKFDPAFTLLKKDIVLVESISNGGSVQIRIKAPKEDKDLRAHIVDVFATGNDICPVKATKKWYNSARGAEDDQPAFRWGSGVPVTIQDINSMIAGKLKGYLDYHKITAHSFRIGRASMMGTLGFSDIEVQAAGRWSSRAFEHYIKLPRTKRIEVQREMSKRSA